MDKILNRIHEVQHLSKQLELLFCEEKTPAIQKEIKQIITDMERKLQTIWICTVEFNTDLSKSRKEGYDTNN